MKKLMRGRLVADVTGLIIPMRKHAMVRIHPPRLKSVKKINLSRVDAVASKQGS